MSDFILVINAPDGTHHEQPVYQSPFYIGSQPEAQLQLSDADIPGSALRLLATGGEELLLMTLSPDTEFWLDGTLLTPQPVPWSVGQTLQVGRYVLSLRLSDSGTILQPRDAAAEPPVRPSHESSVDTQEETRLPSLPDSMPGVSSSPPPLTEPPVPLPQLSRREMPIIQPESPQEDDRTDVMASVNNTDDDPGLLPEPEPLVDSGYDTAMDPMPPPPVMNQKPPAPANRQPEPPRHRTDESHHTAAYPDHLLYDSPRTPDPFLPRQAAAPPPLSSMSPLSMTGNHMTAAWLENTQPRTWYHGEKLSVQPLVNPVKLFAGERVRLPVTIRNDYPRPLTLQFALAGLPETWTCHVPRRIALAQDDILTVDMILVSQPGGPARQFDLRVHLSDAEMPAIHIQFVLTIMLRDAPNLRAWYDTAIPGRDGLIYLNLQNLTRAALPVVITTLTDSPLLRIHNQQPRIDLPPGQVMTVALNSKILKRPIWSDTRADYHAIITQETRAPLDIPGDYRIRSHFGRIGRWLVLILAFVILIALVTISVMALSTRLQIMSTVAPVPSLTRTLSESSDESEDENTEAIPPGATIAPTVSTIATTQIPLNPATRESVSTVSAADRLRTPQPSTETDNREADAFSPLQTLFASLSPPTASLTQTSAAPPTDIPRIDGCPVPVPAGWTLYTIQAGDSLFRLSTDRATTLQEVQSVNCILNPQLILPGQSIYLPPAS